MSFSRVLGQETAKNFLKQAISRDKIPHAYLFTGISGIGKTTTARALSMALNCHAPVDFDACGLCPSCRQINSGNFPDLLYVKPDGQQIKIEQIRELNRRLSFIPITNGYRVCIISRAETMTTEAANSFLKTLEEPAPRNILILNATEPLDLLPTIVSRCQRVPFRPLPVQTMTEWLVKEKGLGEETATVLARISEGSLGRALMMCEDGYLDKRQEWLKRLIDLKKYEKEKIIDMAFKIAKEDNKEKTATYENSATGLTDMLAVWETWYRDLLVETVGGRNQLLINMDFSHKLKDMAENSVIDNLIESLWVIDQAQQDLRKMRNRKLVMARSALELKRHAV